jgi:hypothetical protein
MGDVLFGDAKDKASASVPPISPPPRPQTWGEYFREFGRVQFDKVLISLLILFCYKIGYKDGYVGGVGALLYACQSNRFRWN